MPTVAHAVLLLSLAIFSLVPSILALPQPLAKRAPTPLSEQVVNSFHPFIHISNAAYCPSNKTVDWSCGERCDILNEFEVTATGGDGTATQWWFVGYWPVLESVVIGHQGTDPSSMVSLLTNVNIPFRALSSTLFPGVPVDVKVHAGFGESFARAGPAILSAVKETMERHGTNKVMSSGHSLGGALALLSAAMITSHLGSTVDVTTTVFASPRVGNRAWADWIDASTIKYTRIGNMDDPVLILPGRFLGYRHASGEVHIKDDGVWVSCEGQEDMSPGCLVADVGNVVIADPADHDGPYDSFLINGYC